MFPDYVIGKINDSQVEFTLSAKFPYYKRLPTELKEVFRKKLHVFVQVKKFVPRQEFILDDEARILISACAVQLTLGLDDFYFSQFEYILVYPKDYQNPITKNQHRGETNLAGFMCFSYKDILLGISNEHDNFNLGIHEFSHALRLNSFKGGSEDPFFDGYFPKVLAVGVEEYYRIKNGYQSIFRKYAGANLHEFFPVIVEHWFENPEEFKQHHPELYNVLCILLNQEEKNGKIKLGVRDERLTSLNSNALTEEGLFFTQKSFPNQQFLPLPLIVLVFIFPAIFLGQSTIRIVGMIVVVPLLFLFYHIFLKSRTVKFYKKGFYLLSNRGKISDFFSYELLINVAIYDARRSDNAKDIPSGNAGQFSIEFVDTNKEVKTLMFQCHLPMEEVKNFEKFLRSKKVNVLLVGFSDVY